MDDKIDGTLQGFVRPPAGARYIVVDAGSNTVRAMAVKADGAGCLVSYADSFVMSALGRGLSSGQHMQYVAIDQTVEFIADFISKAGPADQVFAVGTAACRDASNAQVLIDLLRERTGVQLRVLAGDEEAHFTYVGAIAACDHAGQQPLVADIGGRSTELVCQIDGNLQTASLEIGARSLTERFLHSDPPAPDEIAKAAACVAKIFEDASAITSAGDVYIAAGGTACTVAFHAGEWQMDAAGLCALRENFCGMSLPQRREALLLDPDRAEVICGGLIILETLAAFAPYRTMRFTIGGLREGVLLTATGAAAVVHAASAD